MKEIVRLLIKEISYNEVEWVDGVFLKKDGRSKDDTGSWRGRVL